MKKNDTGDFSVLYVEPDDERVALFLVIAGQKKPVVLMLAEQVRVFQRPDDFTALKYLKRQQNLTIIFVIAQGGQMAQMAAKNGFPVYLSMDSLIHAVSVGQVARQRSLSRPTIPLSNPTSGSGIAASMGNPTSDSGIATTMGNPTSGSGTAASMGGKSQQEAQKVQGAQISQDGGYRRTIPLPDNGEGPHPVHTMAFRPGRPDVLPQTSQPDVTLLAPKEQPSRISQQVSQAAQMARTATPLPFQPFATQPLTSSVTTATPPMPLTQPLTAPSNAPDMPLTQPLSSRSARSRRIPLLALVLTVALLIGVVGSFLLIPHTLQPAATPAPAIIGQVSYASSGQVSENSSQGIADTVTADFTNIPDPAPHKSYYVWLLSDKKQSDPRSIALGPLQVNRGQAHLLYAGDPQHSNLLLITSRVLVTEEDATVPPISPTLDPNAWRFYGEIPSDPINSANNPQHYSYLDHLRHLLAADPTLDELELQGGLNNWLYQNTGKVLEWASSTRSQWEETKDTGYVRRQATRILEYLDGTTFLYQDLPKGSPLLVNERLARIGLLAVNGPNQDPPSYLAHVDKHLNGLLQASTVTPAVRKQANDLISAMNNVEYWLTQVRHDTQQIMKMSDNQLRQPATLNVIDDMIANANYAYAGQLDPSTNVTRQGIIWVHEHMQSLAHVDVMKVAPGANGLVPQLVPPGGQPKAFIPYGVKR